MQPIWSITANEKDVSRQLSDYLLAIETNEEAEHKSDNITLTLDDRVRQQDNATLAVPHIGTKITVSLGYDGLGLREIGTYLIDEIDVSSQPRSLRLTGRAADMTKDYRAATVKSWNNTTLGEIAEQIAQKHGLEPKIDPSLASVELAHIDQHNESDMAFLNRLAAQYDAVARPMSGKLVVAKRGLGKAINGADLGCFKLTEDMCSDWSFSYRAREEAGQDSGLGPSGGADQQAAGTPGIDKPTTDQDEIL